MRGFDDSEGSIRLREKVAVMEQRITGVESSTTRQIDSNRTYFDEKFNSFKNEMKVYVDQKFLEMNYTIKQATPSEAALPQHIWWTLLGIGILAALSFIILVTGGPPWMQ